MNQAPAYQFYAGDWLKSRSVRLMNDFQRGWYIQLLNEAWDGKPQCMLPDDDELLQVLAGVSDLARTQPDFNARWSAVKGRFKADGEYIYNERQMGELASQKVKREIAVKGGLASAKARESKRKAMQKATAELLSKGNGRSTGVESELNGSPTLHTPTSTPTPAPTPTPKNHTTDPGKTGERAGSGKPKKTKPLNRAPEYTESFETFWRAWFKRPGGQDAKAPAFARWELLPPDDHPKAIDAAEIVHPLRKADPEALTIARTWLENRTFDDVLDSHSEKLTDWTDQKTRTLYSVQGRIPEEHRALFDADFADPEYRAKYVELKYPIPPEYVSSFNGNGKPSADLFDADERETV